MNIDMPAMSYRVPGTPELAAAYPGYGPPTYRGGTNVNPDVKGDQVQTEGVKPKDCILVEDNWCGVEVPQYTDQEGCLAVRPRFLSLNIYIVTLS